MGKRRLAIGLAAIAAACGGAATLTSPTSSVSTGGRVAVLETTASPTPCPSIVVQPSPSVAIFSVSARPSSSCGTLHAAFKISPNPPVGGTPLQVTFDMCRSKDTDPAIALGYHVTYGDGQEDGGSCRLKHDYTGLGQYTATACVNDESPADRVCQSYTVSVGDACDATFSNASGSGRGTCTVAVQAITQGNTTCGNPLSANLAVSGGPNPGALAACPSGHPCTLQFRFPEPSSSSFPVATVSANNAKAKPLSFCLSGCSVQPLSFCTG
jgi:hypothetical protein